jgi:hypothetical protein
MIKSKGSVSDISLLTQDIIILSISTTVAFVSKLDFRIASHLLKIIPLYIILYIYCGLMS